MLIVDGNNLIQFLRLQEGLRFVSKRFYVGVGIQLIVLLA